MSAETEGLDSPFPDPFRHIGPDAKCGECGFGLVDLGVCVRCRRANVCKLNADVRRFPGFGDAVRTSLKVHAPARKREEAA